MHTHTYSHTYRDTHIHKYTCIYTPQTVTHFNVHTGTYMHIHIYMNNRYRKIHIHTPI